MNRAYRLLKMKGGLDRYGKCECCAKLVDVPYMLVTYWGYLPSIPSGAGKHIERYCHRSDVFGHRECLADITDTEQGRGAYAA